MHTMHMQMHEARWICTLNNFIQAYIDKQHANLHITIHNQMVHRCLQTEENAGNTVQNILQSGSWSAETDKVANLYG